MRCLKNMNKHKDRYNSNYIFQIKTSTAWSILVLEMLLLFGRPASVQTSGSLGDSQLPAVKAFWHTKVY